MRLVGRFERAATRLDRFSDATISAFRTAGSRSWLSERVPRRSTKFEDLCLRVQG
jgi:hypothetical protein